MTTHVTAAPRQTAARRYSEQLHTLVDDQTRAYILGLAQLQAEAGGYARPKEGEEVRDLLDEAIAARYRKDQDGYRRAVARGQRVLDERRAMLDKRKADTTEMVEAVTSRPA